MSPSIPLTLALLGLLAAPAFAEDSGPRLRRGAQVSEPSDSEAAQAELAREHRAKQIAFAEDLIGQTRMGPQRLELGLRLAELYMDDARDLHLREMKSFTEGIDRCDPDPTCDPATLTPDHAGSRGRLEQAVKLYGAILHADPGFARADEASYHLAYALSELGREDEALAELLRLVKGWPDSRLLPQAYVLIGEHYFDHSEAYKALLAYQRAASFDGSDVQAYALYKLGWCQYNVGEYGEAILSMQRVVKLSTQAEDAGEAQGDAQLQEEALKDLVRFFADAGQIDEAWTYFTSLGREEMIAPLLLRLADSSFERGEHEEGVVILRRLIAQDPKSPKAAGYQRRIADAQAKLADPEATLAELERLREDYGPGSAWARANAADPDALAEARRLLEEGLRTAALDLHTEAHKLGGGPRAEARYAYAAQAYRAYLKEFGDGARAYELRYAYAELLYSTKAYAEAHAQYVAVVEMDPAGPRAELCAESAIFAAEELVAGAPHEHGEALASSQVSPQVSPRELSEEEALELAAVERYLALFPESEKASKLHYRAAYLLYAHDQLAEAAARFRVVIAMDPGTREASQAAELILDSLVLAEDWAALQETARVFHEADGLGDAAFKQEVFGVYERASFKVVEAQSEAAPLAAAAGYLSFVERFPDSELVDLALNNAGAHLYAEDERAEAIAVWERLLARPESDYRAATLASLGWGYEEQAEFARAAELYEALFIEFPENEGANAAVYSAALFRRAMGEWEQAIVNYERFAAAAPDDRKAPLIPLDVAALYEEAGRFTQAAEVYASIWDGEAYSGDQRAWMRLAYGRCLERAGEAERALAHYAEAVAWYHRAEAEGVAFEAGLTSLGEMMMALVEPEYQAFIALELSGPRGPATRAQEDRVLARQVSEKLAALSAVKASYTEIVNLGAGEPSLHAAVRLGEVFEDMAQTFADSHVPSYLSEEQRAFYVENLNDRVWQQQELAVEVYAFALEQAHAVQLYDAPVGFAAQRLTALRPADYPALEEALLPPEYSAGEQERERERQRALELLAGPERKVEVEAD